MGERAIAAEARDLTKDFDGKRAVDGVSLSVPEGSITGILGPNGAGKTTIRMLLGIIDPTSGTRSLLGHDRPLEVARLVGYLPEERGLYPSMTAAEAIAFIRGRSIVKQWVIIDEAQNLTPKQVKGIITRAGKGTKIILIGDPEQIDHPFLDIRTNGLSFASERMKGSPLCFQLTLTDEECERSELAYEAARRM
jgi:ABC-type protease/lipase transport system fused ATPase/permease subunit